MSFLLSAAAAITIAVCPPPPARRETCVHDGDTLWIAHEKIRLLDIDAPELDAIDPEQRRLAILARDRLVALLDGEAIVILRDGRDCFGRTLARIETAHGDVGETLLREHRATRYTGPVHPCG